MDPTADKMPKMEHIESLTAERRADRLEIGIPEGLALLQDIKKALFGAKDNPEVAKWVNNITKIESHASRERTVIGVMGNTGSGKSSVINAVLDEEMLVPTNCMRACTAVPTEISYNDSEDPQQAYRADVEFISEAAWSKELTALYSDLFDTEGRLVSDHSNEDSDAGVAYAKIRAVYPNLTKNELATGRLTVAELCKDASVQKVLGTSVTIVEPEAKQFGESLKKYIDSKEKSPGRKKDSEDLFEFWPLIKVVRLYVRSPILGNGLVLVDLPGVQDSNAARSAVASGYQKQCTGLWIVAPITRAVDDKSAQELIGSSFKRQLQFDGAFSNITMICSKTDDMTLTEALRNLAGDRVEDMEALSSEIVARENILGAEKEALGKLRERIKELDKVIEIEDSQMESIQTGIDAASEDEARVPCTPTSSPLGKRKPRAAALEGRKRLRKCGKDLAHSDSDSDFHNSHDDDSDDTVDEETQPEEQIPVEEARGRLEALRFQKKSHREERLSLMKEKKPLGKKVHDLSSEFKRLTSRRHRMCIEYRNNYSRPAIQQQFAMGVREIDQDRSAQADGESFDPSQDLRDYDELASKLPVFCVSSRAYQKMSGKFEKDYDVKGFHEPEDTEIPQLQDHAKALAQQARINNCRRFFIDLLQLLNSLMVQLVISANPLQLVEETRQKEHDHMNRSLIRLEEGLRKNMQDTIASCENMLRYHIFAKLPPAATQSALLAPQAAEAWGAKRDDGGLAFQTYRATCAREGRFKGARGPKDFNEELADLLKKQLVRSWELTFTKIVPVSINSYGLEIASQITKFHLAMKKRPEIVKHASFSLVGKQSKGYGKAAKDTSLLKHMINCAQREANREFTPSIAADMQSGYALCCRESGKGSFVRMKGIMAEYVELHGGRMYQRANGKAQGRLEALLLQLREQMSATLQEMVTGIDEMYKPLVTDNNIFKVLSAAREDISDLLSGADKRFARCFLNPTRAASVPASDEPDDMQEDEDEDDKSNIIPKNPGDMSAAAVAVWKQHSSP